MRKKSHREPWDSLFPNFALLALGPEKSPVSQADVSSSQRIWDTQPLRFPPSLTIFLFSPSLTPYSFIKELHHLLYPRCTPCGLSPAPAVKPSQSVKPTTLRCKVSKINQLARGGSYYICFLLPLHIVQNSLSIFFFLPEQIFRDFIENLTDLLHFPLEWFPKPCLLPSFM